MEVWHTHSLKAGRKLLLPPSENEATWTKREEMGGGAVMMFSHAYLPFFKSMPQTMERNGRI